MPLQMAWSLASIAVWYGRPRCCPPRLGLRKLSLAGSPWRRNAGAVIGVRGPLGGVEGDEPVASAGVRLRGRRISALLPQCRCRTLRCSLAPQVVAWGQWRTRPLAGCARLPTSSCSPAGRPRPAQLMVAPHCPPERVLERRSCEVVCWRRLVVLAACRLATPWAIFAALLRGAPGVSRRCCRGRALVHRP